MQSLFSLFLQTPCPLCQRTPATPFCTACQTQLNQQRFGNPAQFWQEPPNVFAWGEYSGSLKRAIAHLKYDRQPQLAKQFGAWIAQAWLKSSVRSLNPIIVPIPLHLERQQKRGFNQAELLAKQFCQLTGYPLKSNGLQRSRATAALFTLSKSEREQTMIGAFRLGKDFLGKDFQAKSIKKPVILFDDIYTTGSTVRSAMQVLRHHDIQVQGVIVLAKTPFH